jgi:hypothetical protein
MTTAEAIEKIKKLLRMKRGGTDAEIATALKRAMEIAERHGLDLANINPDDDGEPRRVGHVDEKCGVRVSYDHKFAASIIGHFFNVDIIFGSRAVVVKGWPRIERVIHIVGTPVDREIARYAFIFICRQFNYAWRTRRGRCRNRHNFIYGMHIGIWLNLSDSRPQPESAQPSEKDALALSRRSYLQQHWPRTADMRGSKPKSRCQAAEAGFRAGRDTHIRPAIPKSETQPLQIGA